MKKLIFTLFTIAAAGFSLGFLAGCVVDFSSDVEDRFACQSDEDCSRNYVCGTEGFCIVPTAGPTNQNQNQNQILPDECDPEHEDYPFDPPLSIQEVCDGQDNNCDGQIDVITCQSNSDCPSGERDPQDNRVSYECNLQTGLCEAFGLDRLGGPECQEPLACIDGNLEIVPVNCR